jgi:hypothetical protein
MLILYNITHDTTPPNAINILPTSIRDFWNPPRNSENDVIPYYRLYLTNVSFFSFHTWNSIDLGKKRNIPTYNGIKRT